MTALRPRQIDPVDVCDRFSLPQPRADVDIVPDYGFDAAMVFKIDIRASLSHKLLRAAC